MIPNIDAGATFNHRATLPEYSAAAGWVATLYLNPRAGGSALSLTATADGSAHLFQAAGATTAAWLAGSYAWEVWVDKAGERYRVDGGQLLVRATLLAAAGGTDTRTAAVKALDDLRAAWAAWCASGSFTAGSYSIGGRTMQYRTIAELRAAISAAERDVEAEKRADRIAAGLGGRTRFVVRM
jgi:hypothetical protein